jgi:hypothetical protein
MGVRQRELYATAAGADFQPRILPGPAGALLVTVHGARVLGVFLDGSPDNLVWVNDPALRDAEHARRFVGAGEWNLGGDRCWIAPELELFFRNPAKPSHEDWAVPAAIDPGRYSVLHEAQTGVVLQMHGDMTDPATRSPFRFQLTRAICLCPPPVETDGLGYIGYELSSELRVLTPDHPATCYGLWEIMQVPPGGTVFIPTRRPPELVDYFQTGVAAHCRVERAHVAFPVTGQAKHKLGLRAADCYGAMVYYRPGPQESATLIVRQAGVFPGAVYADYPAHQPHRRDVALQFYNDSGAFGGFGEMEYHAPAATAEKLFQTVDVSYTWCFGGPADRIRAVMLQLLGDLSIA